MPKIISFKSIIKESLSKETKKKITNKIFHYMSINQEYHEEGGTLDVYRYIGALSTKISLIEQANEYILRLYTNFYYPGQWIKELKELYDLNNEGLNIALRMSRCLIKKGISTGIYSPEKEKKS
jgi:hypothetical protein